MPSKHFSLLAALCLALPCPAMAGNALDLHGQATYVIQNKPAFSAPYSGPNSLAAGAQSGNSFVATGFVAFEPWAGGAVYLNPEVSLGREISAGLGTGSNPNADFVGSATTDPGFYFSRAYFQQTWSLGGAPVAIGEGLNQVEESTTSQRLVLTAGLLSLLDVFDDTQYTGNTSTQFLNGALTTYGAWDYAADARGYSWGLALGWHVDDWVFRAGRFLLPKVPEQEGFDWSIMDVYADQVEVHRSFELGGRDGRFWLLAFRNHGLMGDWTDALAGGSPPNIASSRDRRTKYGYGVALEQELADHVGAFFRWSWNDGSTENICYSDIDHSLSLGLVLEGENWGRPEDTLGLGWAANGLSSSHRNYLAAGGMTAYLGDGALNYAREQVAEIYYRLRLAGDLFLTFDFQHVNNPGYNADRGPARFYGLRLDWQR